MKSIDRIYGVVDQKIQEIFKRRSGKTKPYFERDTMYGALLSGFVEKAKLAGVKIALLDSSSNAIKFLPNSKVELFFDEKGDWHEIDLAECIRCQSYLAGHLEIRELSLISDAILENKVSIEVSE